MSDMHMRAGFQPDFENLQIRHGLTKRRASAAMPNWLRMPRRLGFLSQAHHDFLILIMHAHHQPGLGDFTKGRDHGWVVNAREAHRVIFIRGKLEGTGAGFREPRNGIHAARFQDGAVKRHIHMG